MMKILLIALYVVSLRVKIGCSENVFNCGVSKIFISELILRGYKTTPDAWPWHVAIYEKHENMEDYICGGTLVTKQHVLTASHCVQIVQNGTLNTLFVRLGVYQLNSSGKEIQQRMIKKIHRTDNFAVQDLRNDIAILQLATEVKFNKYVQPACISLMENLTGQIGTVIGWGVDENERLSAVLKSARLPVVDFYTCLKSDRETFGAMLDEGIFCAGYTNGTAVCNGDSGSGIFFKEKGSWHLGGIVSFSQVRGDGSNRCSTNGYGAFTKIHTYLAWIESVTKLRLTINEDWSETKEMVPNQNHTTKEVVKKSLSAIGSKLIRPRSNYTVAVISSLQRDVQLKIELQNETDIIQQQKITVSRRVAKLVSFYIGDIPQGDYFLKTHSLEIDFYFSEQVELKYEAKTMSVFIQTDKPLYTPGERIRFRVVVVDVDTRPVKSINTISVGLTDGAGESIRHWPYARLYYGVFESVVQLASTPRLGNWTFTVTTKEGQTVRHIKVKEGVAHKFFVRADPSRIHSTSIKEISITVKCYDTSGGAIDGITTVDLYLDDHSKTPDFTLTSHISGTTTMVFNLTDEVEIKGDAAFVNVIAKVKVLDTFSNRNVSITRLIPVYQNIFHVSLLPSKPTFLPGVEFPIEISVKDHSNQPPANPRTIDITVRVEGAHVEGEMLFKKQLNEEGVSSLVLYPPSGANLLTFSVKYNTVDYDTEPKEIRGFRSESNQYIQITLNPNHKIKPNKTVLFDVSCTEPMSHFSYVVVARGSIIEASNVDVSDKKKYSFKYKLLPEMSPEARMIVFYATGQYIIFDDLVLNFEVLRNNFKLDSKQYQPGQDVFIEVKAARDSYIAFQAIDQNMFNVEEDNRSLTSEGVLGELTCYGSKSSITFDPFDVNDSRKNLIQFGDSRKPTIKDSPMNIDTAESWLWVNYAMNGSSMKLHATAPHMITSWYVTGFALSPTLGLGVIRQPVKVKVSKPFYLVANAPYSIRRYKVVEIPVKVCNFLDRTITTNVTMFNLKDEFEIVSKNSNDSTSTTQTVAIASNNVKVISFVIRAKKLGAISISIEASNSLHAIEHIIRVTPESYHYEKEIARFIDLDFHQTKVFNISLDISLKSDEGSVQIKFTLDPDLLGKLIENLENLIRLPTGDGEQNMINFVSNIVILDYLSETGIVSEKIRIIAIKHIKSGYQNQLRYKRSDGSFSIWGGSDTKGSTFLTAFVVKSLKIAAKYIDVDKQVVDSAFQWLANIQNADGSFHEVGKVIHADMQGGLRSTSYALTSYVLIAFTENDEIARQYRNVVTKTMNYLAINFWSISDPYDLALASYGMALGRHADRKKMFDKLMEASVFDDATITRYWNRPPVNIEVAGYALLTFIANGEYVDAVSLMRYLNQQRFGQGGFPGTQDTFVGLKALSKYAAKLSARNNDYQVKIKYKPNDVHTFNVDKTHAMTIFERDIPDHVQRMEIEISGVGYGIFQIAYQYYQNIEEENPRFMLNAEVVNETSHHVQLKVCTAFIPKKAYERSNKAVVEVFFPSGMIAEPNAVKDLSAMQEIKKTELRYAATSIAIYYDGMEKDEVCFEVEAFQKYNTALQLPAYVVVYDKDEQDRFAIKKYERKLLQLCDICEDEDCKVLSC